MEAVVRTIILSRADYATRSDVKSGQSLTFVDNQKRREPRFTRLVLVALPRGRQHMVHWCMTAMIKKHKCALAAIALLLCSANALPSMGKSSFNISVGGPLDSDTLNRGQTLNSPASLVAGGGNVRLQVQGDGNLVIVEGQSDVLWASNTGPCVPAGQCQLFFWDDGANSGDVVLYGCPNCGKVLWETKTCGRRRRRQLLSPGAGKVL